MFSLIAACIAWLVSQFTSDCDMLAAAETSQETEEAWWQAIA